MEKETYQDIIADELSITFSKYNVNFDDACDAVADYKGCEKMSNALNWNELAGMLMEENNIENGNDAQRMAYNIAKECVTRLGVL